VTSVVEGAEAFGLHTMLADGVLPLDRSGVSQALTADRARGVAATSETARALAVAEALERYTARSPWLEAVTTHPPVNEVRISLAELWPYSEQQLAVWEADAGSGSFSNLWVRAQGLNAAPVWLPEAAMVIGERRNAARAAQVTSNGFAAGASATFARGRAIAELIERDAVMTTWFHRRPAMPLAVACLGSWAERASEDLSEVGVHVTLWLLAAAVNVPVVLAVGKADGRTHLTLSIGAACAADIPQAAGRALRELASNVAATAEEILEGNLSPVAEAAVASIDDHAAYYRNPHTANALDFLDPGIAPVSIVDLERVFNIEDECRSAGLRVASLDVTPPDVAQCGLRVVRALSPDLVPIWFGWHREPLQHLRLRSSAPNRKPHPFR
jgi:thiazole/oxazole-forming peptide maturase SagD family component